MSPCVSVCLYVFTCVSVFLCFCVFLCVCFSVSTCVSMCFFVQVAEAVRTGRLCGQPAESVSDSSVASFPEKPAAAGHCHLRRLHGGAVLRFSESSYITSPF